MKTKTEPSPVIRTDRESLPEQEDYDDSPQIKVTSQLQDQQDEKSQSEGEKDEVDEDEMIDVAEKIFIRIAEEIIAQKLTVRKVLQRNIFYAEIDGEQFELLSPMGLIEGIKELGITDLTEQEVDYLLKVLSKPELDGAILMQELLQIMENFGLYDDDEQMAEPSPPVTDQKKNKGDKNSMDLSKLDQKSVKIMVMLMLYLLENNMTTAQFFQSVTYQQNVKSKTKSQMLDILTSKDFFRLLAERGIRKKDSEHDNLRQFLMLSPAFKDLLVLKSIKRTLEQMAENEEFMEAIREDLMQGEDGEQIEDYENEIARIQNAGDSDDQ